MANDLTGNPLLIDTASANPIKPLGGPIFVNSFVWTPSAGGQACIIQDYRGRTIIEMVSNVDAVSNVVSPTKVLFGCRIPIRGLAVTTLGSGVLAIFI